MKRAWIMTMRKMILIGVMILAALYTRAVADAPQRIVSLAPNITEMVFRLGQGDRLVGRTEFCTYPPAALGVPAVGGYLDLDYERLVALQPDLVLMLPSPDREKKLGELGLHVFTLKNETVDDNLQSLRALGEVLDCPEEAAVVIEGIQDTLDAIRQWAETAKPSVTALLVIGREAGSLKGLYAAGSQTYLSELWELCGGRNCFPDAPARYFEVSKEALIRVDPDVVLEFRVIAPEEAGEQIALLKQDWQELPVLQAVKNRRIYIFRERYFLIPGPRLTRIAVAFRELLERITSP